jgi:HSP20 family protein
MLTRNLSRREDLYPSIIKDFFNPWNDIVPTASIWGSTMNIPAVNIKETDKMYTIHLAAPGLNKKDFVIRIENNTLSISCEKETQPEESDEQYSRREYNFSSFNRNFSLPEEVNSNNIEATYDNGMLTLMLPKKEEAIRSTLSRSIAIQ